ncbi:MAG: FtsW/RodA/SpoVE family cell cycle protein [Lachnospiraceae bacterium]|nr:FtsW/RodA/SpoVE family cell cycle protein [Lachnospiraceae bacterium]
MIVSRMRLKRIFSRFRNYDYTLLLLVAIVMGIGVVMIYSSSAPEKGNSYFKRQLLYCIASIFVMYAGSFIIGITGLVNRFMLKTELPFGKKWYFSILTLGYIVVALFQLMPLIQNKPINNYKRWIVIGDVQSGNYKTIQPSEVTKAFLIVYSAYLIIMILKTMGWKKITKWYQFVLNVFPLAVYFALTGILIVLVMKEDLSTAIVMLIIVFGMTFMGLKWEQFAAVFVYVFLGILAGYFMIFHTDAFRIERINIWREVETHEKGQQILQGMYAIANGGFLGKGLGNSVQKLGNVPESYNDMIFTIYCEELGVLGAFLLLFIYLLLIFRLLYIASKAVNRFETLIAYGIAIHITAQVCINVLVSTNAIPSTGIPLPFVSYGISSLIGLTIEMTIALSIARKSIEHNLELRRMESLGRYK